ncbi:hypothetical protein U9M48_037103 [Paspalum notatum var. saurae]|uniref:Uncharacterized protein n=1 Tax=Paspalum notatum var. saurae TaxID=547442 RepID=A0AAQ3UEA8_PASNO
MVKLQPADSASSLTPTIYDPQRCPSPGLSPFAINEERLRTGQLDLFLDAWRLGRSVWNKKYVGSAHLL